VPNDFLNNNAELAVNVQDEGSESSLQSETSREVRTLYCSPVLKADSTSPHIMYQWLEYAQCPLQSAFRTQLTTRLDTVTAKNAVFWNVMPCGSCKNRRFGGMYRLHHQGEEINKIGTLVS
jgi:hypothetical protein